MSANVASADAEAKPKRPASKGRRKYPPKSAKAKEASRAKYLAKKLASGDELTEAQLAGVEELGGREAVLEREAKRKERAAALETDVARARALTLRSFGDDDPIGLTAVVTLVDEDTGNVRRVLLAPAGGGAGNECSSFVRRTRAEVEALFPRRHEPLRCEHW